MCVQSSPFIHGFLTTVSVILALKKKMHWRVKCLVTVFNWFCNTNQYKTIYEKTTNESNRYLM